MEQNDLAGTKRYLSRALSLDPENTKIISNLGFVALKEKDTEKAKQYFAAALEIAPDDKIAAAELLKLERSENENS